MNKIFISTVVLIGTIFALFQVKNGMIEKEFRVQVESVSDLSYENISCGGMLLKSECSIYNIAYQKTKVAERVTIYNIDPTVSFQDGDFIELPLDAKIVGIYDSMFDISSLFNDEIAKSMESFFKKYTSGYDADIQAIMLTDGKTVKSVNITKLDVQDKLTPFIISANIKNINTFPILQSFQGTFNLSKKRIIFYDFITQMRECCKDKIPSRYIRMNNEETWNHMISQTISILDLNLKKKFNQNLEINIMNAAKKILQEEKTNFFFDLKAKQAVPLEEIVMKLFLVGPDILLENYDITVKAK